LGKGCGAPCIESAKLDQVYEIAADLAATAVVLGMLPLAQWKNIASAILTQGEQAFGQLEAQGDGKAKNGLANMQKVLAALAPVEPAKTQAYNWQLVESTWLGRTNPAGWYPDSLTSGENLADTLMSNSFTNAG